MSKTVREKEREREMNVRECDGEREREMEKKKKIVKGRQLYLYMKIRKILFFSPLVSYLFVDIIRKESLFNVYIIFIPLPRFLSLLSNSYFHISSSSLQYRALYSYSFFVGFLKKFRHHPHIHSHHIQRKKKN